MSISDFTLTAGRLRELLTYDPLTGEFKWLCSGPGRRKDLVAGCTNKRRGVRLIRVDDVLYMAHRLAWLYMTGEWPKNEIDHIDTDPANNSFSNLRDVNRTVNQQNMRRPRVDNQLGHLGICMDRGKFMVQLNANGKRRLFQRFGTLEEASAAYLKAKRQLHEGCTI